MEPCLEQGGVKLKRGFQLQRAKKMKLSFNDSDRIIRNALKDACKKGKLDVVAAVTGVAGGEKYLCKIMNSTKEISVIDRSILGMHLDI